MLNLTYLVSTLHFWIASSLFSLQRVELFTLIKHAWSMIHRNADSLIRINTCKNAHTKILFNFSFLFLAKPIIISCKTNYYISVTGWYGLVVQTAIGPQHTRRWLFGFNSQQQQCITLTFATRTPSKPLNYKDFPHPFYQLSSFVPYSSNSFDSGF